jgi:hypothetical protein
VENITAIHAGGGYYKENFIQTNALAYFSTASVRKEMVVPGATWKARCLMIGMS